MMDLLQTHILSLHKRLTDGLEFIGDIKKAT